MLRKQQIIIFIINRFLQGVNLLMLEFCWRCQQILPIWNGLKEDYRTVRILVEKKTSRCLLTEWKFFFILNIPHGGIWGGWIVSDITVWKMIGYIRPDSGRWLSMLCMTDQKSGMITGLPGAHA
ncbi:hypothetical protein DXB18_07905 [Clostridium sp. OM02-18AC]|nr:hypothetical protein DXB18_07905 [Clostridium sp. OM02-18AC]